MACQDWADTKAAYRFFSNERVDEGDILACHFQATHDRFAAREGTVLALQLRFLLDMSAPSRGLVSASPKGRASLA